MRKKAMKVTGGGLLDLRKITLGHRSSLTVTLPLSKEGGSVRGCSRRTRRGTRTSA